MHKKELPFQEEIINKTIKLLREQKIVSIQAPTGSGKTFMASRITSRVINDKTAVVFIAPSIGSLYEQAYESFLEEHDRRTLYNLEESSNEGVTSFSPKNIYFVGWNKLINKESRWNKGSEEGGFFEWVENTKAEGTDVVLFVDESHLNDADTTKASFVIEQINPRRIIKLSATPKGIVDIPLSEEEVRSSGLILNNPQINPFEIEGKVTWKSILDIAFKKQIEVRKDIDKLGVINFDPLMLIQMNTGSNKEMEIANHLMKQGAESGEIAIWLSEEKVLINGEEKLTKDVIVNADNGVKYLIFKNAIATGWNVPRANMLVTFRNRLGSTMFIQTRGRIMRNPYFNILSKDSLTKNMSTPFIYTTQTNFKNGIVTVDGSVIEKTIIDIKVKDNLAAEVNKILVDIKTEDIDIDQVVIDFVKTRRILKTFDSIGIADNQEFVKDLLSDTILLREGEIVFVDEPSVSSQYEQIEKFSNSRNLNLNLFEIFMALEGNVKYAKDSNDILRQIYISTIDGTLLKYISYKLKPRPEYSKGEKWNIPSVIQDAAEYYSDEFLDRISTTEDSPLTMPGLDLELTIFDSETERVFYNGVKNYAKLNKREEIYLFRNQDKKNYSYSMEYYNPHSNEVHNFYPDFIMIWNGVTYVIEVKANEGSMRRTDLAKKRAIMSNGKLLNAKPVLVHEQVNGVLLMTEEYDGITIEEFFTKE